jgi:hypothetical protein
MRSTAIGVSNEIGDSRVDRQSYVAFVIEVAATCAPPWDETVIDIRARRAD